jgi:hypothetical protein
MITAAFAAGASAAVLFGSTATAAAQNANRHRKTIAVSRSGFFIIWILPLYCWFGNIN